MQNIYRGDKNTQNGGRIAMLEFPMKPYSKLGNLDEIEGCP